MLTADPNEKYETNWRRFWAALIDGFVFLPLLPLNEMIVQHQSPGFLLLLWSGFFAFLPHVYRILLHYKFGQTFGKMIMKVKIVDFDSERFITPRQTVLRDIIPVFLALLLLVSEAMYLIEGQDIDTANTIAFFANYSFAVWTTAEIISIFTNTKRRMIHDFIAGTVVVETNI